MYEDLNTIGDRNLTDLLSGTVELVQFHILFITTPLFALIPAENAPVPLFQPGHGISGRTFVPDEFCELFGPVSIHP